MNTTPALQPGFFVVGRFVISNWASLGYFVSFPHQGINLDITPFPVYIYRPPQLAVLVRQIDVRKKYGHRNKKVVFKVGR